MGCSTHSKGNSAPLHGFFIYFFKKKEELNHQAIINPDPASEQGAFLHKPSLQRRKDA